MSRLSYKLDERKGKKSGRMIKLNNSVAIALFYKAVKTRCKYRERIDN